MINSYGHFATGLFVDGHHGQDIDFTGHTLQWTLKKTKESNSSEDTTTPKKLSGERIALSRILSGEQRRFEMKQNDESAATDIFDRLKVKIFDSEGYSIAQYKEILTCLTTNRGPLSKLHISLFCNYRDKKPSIGGIKAVQFKNEIFSPQLNAWDSGSYTFSSDEPQKRDFYNRFFLFQDLHNSIHRLLMSHMWSMYRGQDRLQPVHPVKEQIERVQQHTHLSQKSVTIIKDQKVYDYEGQLLNVAKAMYAIDGRGQLKIIAALHLSGPPHFSDGLLTEDGKNSKYLPGKRIVHSMLVKSEAVACAGEITVTEGKITKLDNSSGHYTPTTLQLSFALNYLEAQYDIISEDLQVGYYNTSIRDTELCSLSHFREEVVPKLPQPQAPLITAEVPSLSRK